MATKNLKEVVLSATGELLEIERGLETTKYKLTPELTPELIGVKDHYATQLFGYIPFYCGGNGGVGGSGGGG